MSYEITFGGRFQAGLGITTGKVVVKAGNLYLPATTANIALYPIAGLVVRYQQVPSANYDVGDIAHAGVWPSSLTGLTAATAGVATYARVTSTGSLESTTAPNVGDWLMGRINTDGDLILVPANEYGSGVSNLGYTIVNLTEYGGVGTDDSSSAVQSPLASANYEAFRAAVADAPILGIDEIEVPGLYYPMNDTVCVWDDDDHDNIRGLRIVGERRRKMDPGKDKIVWYLTTPSGVAASLIDGAAGAADVNQGNHVWTYYRVTGITGARSSSATSKGDTIHELELSGCAQAACNGIYPIVKVNSATEVVIAVPNSIALAATDANNGAITWQIKRSVLDMRGRDNVVLNLGFFAFENCSVQSFVRITAAPGPGHFPLSNAEWTDIDAGGAYLGKTDYTIDFASTIVPDVGHSQYLLETANNYKRPFSPPQLDYQYFDGIRNVGYTGPSPFKSKGVLRCANTTQQSRSNVFINCGANYSEKVVDVRTKFGTGKSASMGFGFYEGSAGTVDDVIWLEQPQAQVVIDYMYNEQYSRLITINNPTSDLSFVVIRGGGLNSGGADAPTDMDGVVVIRNGGAKIVFDSVPFGILAPFTREGQLVSSTSGTHSYITFRNCSLPNPSVFAKHDWQAMFLATGSYMFVEITGCTSIDFENQAPGWQAVPDMKFALGGQSADAGGTLALSKFGGLGFGLSNNESATTNFLTEITISDAATRKGWEFRDAEHDERLNGHDYKIIAIPTSYTGAPSAGSLFGNVVDRCRRTAALELSAAPGVGSSRTFSLFSVRDRATPVSSFHPNDIDGIVWWFRADDDWLYSIPRSPYQADIVDGRKYWRNQGPIRETSSGNTPVMDVYPLSDDATNQPSTRTLDAGYNNHYVITGDINDILYAYHSAANPSLAAPVTFFVVGEPGTGNVNKTPCSIYNGTDAMFLRADGTTNIALYGGPAGAPVGITYAHNWNAKQVLAGVINGASSALYLSALTAVVTGTCGGMSAINAGGFSIYDHVYQNQGFAGTGGTAKIAEILVYSGALTNTQIGQVITYLGTKYGKSIGP